MDNEKSGWRKATAICCNKTLDSVGLAFSSLKALRDACETFDPVIDRAIDDALSSTLALASVLATKGIAGSALPYERRGMDLRFEIEDVIWTLQDMLCGHGVEIHVLSFGAVEGMLAREKVPPEAPLRRKGGELGLTEERANRMKAS